MKVLLSDNLKSFQFAILNSMSPSAATLPKTKAKLRYEFFIVVKSKCISTFVTQKDNSVYLQFLYSVNSYDSQFSAKDADSQNNNFFTILTRRRCSTVWFPPPQGHSGNSIMLNRCK
jgi:hypothetical protein